MIKFKLFFIIIALYLLNFNVFCQSYSIEQLYFPPKDKDYYKEYNFFKANLYYRLGIYNASFKQLDKMISDAYPVIGVQCFLNYVKEIRKYIHNLDEIKWAYKDIELLINELLENMHNYNELINILPPSFEIYSSGIRNYSFTTSSAKNFVLFGGIHLEKIEEPEIIHYDNGSKIILREENKDLLVIHIEKLKNTIFKKLKNRYVIVGIEYVEYPDSQVYKPEKYKCVADLKLIYGEINKYTIEQFYSDDRNKYKNDEIQGNIVKL